MLDRLGSPWIAEGVDGLVEWLDVIKPVAGCPNIVAKLSGLITLADWERWCLDDLRPYVDHAVSLFGPKRLMFGSDWPVCELAAKYDQTMNAMVSLLGGTPADVFAGTAMRTYRLGLTQPLRSMRSAASPAPDRACFRPAGRDGRTRAEAPGAHG